MKHGTVKASDLGDNWTAEAHLEPEIPADVRDLAAAVGADPETWRHNCHVASLAIVRSGIYPGARVARGAATGVGGQHSWVVVGHDVYDRSTQIIDPTLWSYDASVRRVWIGTLADKVHEPKGYFGGTPLIAYGHPPRGSGPAVRISRKGLSADAVMWLDMLSPMDRWGWAALMNYPMTGWPAGEIIERILDTPELGEVLVPIDIIGMLTDRNPSGLYLREGA